MNQAEELIRLEDLAAEYQRIIGSRCVIHLNAATDIEEEREQGYMVATRQPYKIPKIKSESLQIAIRFYVACEQREEYNDAINALTNLIGYRSGRLTSKGRLFKYFSFIDFAAPLNEPVIDEGQFKQVLEMRGTCLVTQASGGAIVGNEIQTIFSYKDDNNVAVFGELMVLTDVPSLTKTTEAPQMSNAVTAKAFNNTQSYTFAYTVLLVRDAISERIYMALRNIKPFGVNEEVQIYSRSPEFTPLVATVDKTTWDASAYGTRVGKTVFIYYGGAWKLKTGALPSSWLTLTTSVASAGITITSPATMHDGAMITVTKTANGTVSILTDNGALSSHRCTVTGGALQVNAGAFITAELSFQEYLDLSALNGEIEDDGALENTERFAENLDAAINS